jgi:parvulin-like peptidyl-prolyl isomerase
VAYPIDRERQTHIDLRHGGHGPALQRATATQVQRIFGESFAEALAALPVDSWQGPVRSTFGVHLVRLSASEPARPATLAEARAEGERDFLQHRAARASAARYQALRARYAVRVDAAATTAQ